jgi:hypothetical protein
MEKNMTNMIAQIIDTHLTLDSLKDEAKHLKNILVNQGVDYKLAQSLDAVSQLKGFRNWQTARAMIIQAYDELNVKKQKHNQKNLLELLFQAQNQVVFTNKTTGCQYKIVWFNEEMVGDFIDPETNEAYAQDLLDQAAFEYLDYGSNWENDGNTLSIADLHHAVKQSDGSWMFDDGMCYTFAVEGIVDYF